jgi:sugar transferase (PEP-CTERM/EpsH1 system associated)
MKILWVKTDFLHPADRGGQIRSLEMLRRLHLRHEVHYLAFGGDPESVSRSREYCSRAYPVAHHVPAKTTAAFAWQLAGGLFSPLPVAVSRYASERMRAAIRTLTARQRFDSIVCDFLFPSPNFPDLSRCVLFQHNVESVIWKRYVENAANPLRRRYFQLQARRMLDYEGRVCRAVRKVIAVSDADADAMRRLYGVHDVAPVATGVDFDYFARPASPKRMADLVFLGSMDWMPNIDGAAWFVREVLPLIRRVYPECSLAIVGRRPARALKHLAREDPRILVTGTVPDVRPWLFGALVSVVPLRIGGGTRLKIYEAMAAEVPVVSTAVGAEGLDVRGGEDILIADSPAEFAARCVRLLANPGERARLAAAARENLAGRHSWDTAAWQFERLLCA